MIVFRNSSENLIAEDQNVRQVLTDVNYILYCMDRFKRALSVKNFSCQPQGMRREICTKQVIQLFTELRGSAV